MILYAEVLYEPTFGDISIRLNSTWRYVTPMYSSVASGVATLHTALNPVSPGGVYRLDLFQPSPALGNSHCVPFSFRLVIRDAYNSSASDLTCAELSRLPADLSDAGNSQVR